MLNVLLRYSLTVALRLLIENTIGSSTTSTEMMSASFRMSYLQEY